MLDRLLEEGDRSGPAGPLAAAVRARAGHDVDGDVPRLGVALQVVEHSPSVHDGELHVEDDGVRLQLAREREAAVPAERDEPLEAPLARDLQNRSG